MRYQIIFCSLEQHELNLPAFATDGILGSLAAPAIVLNIARVTGATVAPVMISKVKKVAGQQALIKWKENKSKHDDTVSKSYVSRHYLYIDT